MEIAQSDAAAYMDWYRIETWKAYERPQSEVTGNASDNYERRAPGTAGMREGVRYQIYDTADGHVLFMASEQAFWKNFCEGVGRMDLFERWPGSKYADHARNNRELQRELRDIFKTKTTGGVDRVRQRGQHADRAGEHAEDDRRRPAVPGPLPLDPGVAPRRRRDAAPAQARRRGAARADAGAERWASTPTRCSPTCSATTTARVAALRSSRARSGRASDGADADRRSRSRSTGGARQARRADPAHACSTRRPRLLETHGVRDLRVVDIARAVGTSPATFYQYFRDVEEAVLVARRGGRRGPRAARRRCSPGLVGRRRGLDAARVTGRARSSSTGTRHRAVLRTRNLAAQEGDPRFRDVRNASLRPLTEGWRRRSRSRSATGASAPRSRPMAAAAALVAMMERMAAFHADLEPLGVTPRRARRDDRPHHLPDVTASRRPDRAGRQSHVRRASRASGAVTSSRSRPKTFSKSSRLRRAPHSSSSASSRGAEAHDDE